MPAAREPKDLAGGWKRLLAVGAAFMVLALSVFAASPRLHDTLHAGTDCGTGSDCPVELFAQGVSLTTALATAIPTVVVWHDAIEPTPVSVFLSSPRYLRRPERGPPVSSIS